MLKHHRMMMRQSKTPRGNEKRDAIADESKPNIHRMDVRKWVVTLVSENCRRQITAETCPREKAIWNNETGFLHDSNSTIAYRRKRTTFCRHKTSNRIGANDETCAGISEMKLKSRGIHTRSVSSLIECYALLFRTAP